MFKNNPKLLQLKSELSQKKPQKTHYSSNIYHKNKSNQTENATHKYIESKIQNQSNSSLVHKKRFSLTHVAKGSRVCRCGCKEDDFLNNTYSNDDVVLNNNINSEDFIKNDSEEYVCPCCIQSQILNHSNCCSNHEHNHKHDNDHTHDHTHQYNIKANNSDKIKNKDRYINPKFKSKQHNLKYQEQLKKINYENYIDSPELLDNLIICNCDNVTEIKEQTAQFCKGKNCTCVHDNHRINHEQIVGILRIKSKGFGFVEAANKSYYVSPQDCAKCINNCEVAFVKYKNKEGNAANIKSLLPKLLTNTVVYISSVSPLRIKLENDCTNKTYPAHLVPNLILNNHELNVNDCFLASPIDINASLNDPTTEIEFNLSKYIGNDNDLYLEWYKTLATHNLPFVTKDNLALEKCCDLGSRIDLTRIPFVSIDSEDTLDIDDLVYCYELSEQDKVVNSRVNLLERDKKSFYTVLNEDNLTTQSILFPNYTGLNDANLNIPTGTKFILAVAIADPSYFFNAHSDIDEQAKLFTQTYYLPALTVNMLPEFVVHNYCSLMPNEHKPALVSFIYFDDKANFIAIENRIAKVINKFKLDYENVTKYLENPEKNSYYKDHLDKLFLDQIELLLKFYNYRIDWRNQHSRLINNSNANINYTINEKGTCIDIDLKEFSLAHKIISECMLCTNTYLAQSCKHKQINVIYTAQDGIKDNNYIHFLEYLKYLINEKSYHDINSVLDIDYLIKNTTVHDGCICDSLEDSIQNSSCLNLDEFRKIRSIIESNSPTFNNRLNRFMQSGRYCLNPENHQGLGENCYLTCTSPIRKYVDLFNQRNIKYYMWEQEQIACEQGLIDHLNETRLELRATHRDIAKELHYQYLLNKIDQEFVVEVNSVINAGVRVKIVNCGIIGFIYIGQLNPQQLDVDTNINNLTVKIGNELIEFGDCFKAILKRVEKDKFIFNPVLDDNNKIIRVN